MIGVVEVLVSFVLGLLAGALVIGTLLLDWARREGYHEGCRDGAYLASRRKAEADRGSTATFTA